MPSPRPVARIPTLAVIHSVPYRMERQRGRPMHVRTTRSERQFLRAARVQSGGSGMQNYLVITALGEDRPGIINRLSGAIADAGCNVVDSRMTVLGGEFAVMQMIDGRWDALARLEDALPGLGDELGLHIHWKRTREQERSRNLLPYSVEVVAMDHPGIVHQLAQFFSGRGINIRDLSTTRYPAAHTGTPMFAVNMLLEVPGETQIAVLREEFLDFCDQMNLDAVFEPVKH